MHLPKQPTSEIDHRHFVENLNRFPREELLAYAGKQVAWNGDGTRIVASADTEEELLQKLRELDVPLSRVVLDCID